MTSLFKRFRKQDVVKTTKTKIGIVKKERKRRAKLNFTKDSFKKLQSPLHELRRRIESSKDISVIFNTQNLSEKQLQTLRKYAQSENSQSYAYDRVVHWIYCDGVERAVLATILREETRKRLKNQDLMIIREEIRQGARAVVSSRKRSLSANKILVDFLGFSSSKNVSKDLEELAQSVFQDKKKKKIDAEELLDFVLDHISDLLYFQWKQNSKLKFPKIVSVIRTTSGKEETRLKRKLYRRMHLDGLWFGREDCEDITDSDQIHLMDITISSSKKQMRKENYKRVFGNLWCKWSTGGKKKNKEELIRDLCLTKGRVRPNVTFQYVGQLPSSSNHLWISRYRDVRGLNFVAVQKSLNELREDVQTYEREKNVDAFELFDSDRNGSVPLKEFRSALKLIGACDGLGEKEIETMLRYIDQNGDGTINATEMRIFVTSSKDDEDNNNDDKDRFVPMYRPEQHDDEIQGGFSKKSALRVTEACETLRQDIHKYALTDYRRTTGNENPPFIMDDSYFRSTFELFDFNGNGQVEEEEFVSQLEHLGIGSELSKHEMRCVHAQVCDTKDMITISSFVRFANAEEGHSSEEKRKDENRVRLKDGRTLTPRTEFDTTETSRPGRIDLIVESVENVPKTSFVGRSQLYVRSRLVMSNSTEKRTWRKTKSVLCDADSVSWPDDTKIVHKVSRELDRSVAVVVELMDLDDLSGDDVCVGRGTFYVRLSSLSPRGSIKMEFALAPPSLKLNNNKSSTQYQQQIQDDVDDTKKIVPIMLRATLHWIETDDNNNNNKVEGLKGTMYVRVEAASKLPSSCSLRSCWLVHRLVSSTSTTSSDTSTSPSSLAIRGVRDEVNVYWPDSCEIELTCRDEYTDQIIELWATSKERPILVAACKIPLEPIQRHLEENGMLSAYEVEKVRLTDKRGITSRGELSNIRIRVNNTSSSSITTLPFDKIEGHVGYVTCELLRVVSEANILNGRLVSCSVSCTGTPKRIRSMVRIGAAKRLRRSDDDRARVEIALVKLREKDETVRPTITVAMYDMHRGDEDVECIACGSILLLRQEKMSVRLRDADGHVFVAEFLMSYDDDDRIEAEDEMLSTIRSVSPELTPPPPSSLPVMSPSPSSSSSFTKREESLKIHSFVRRKEKKEEEEEEEEEEEDVESAMKRLFDITLDSGHTVSILRRRFSELEERLNFNTEGGTLPRTTFRHFLQDNTSFRTSVWSKLLSEFCEFDASTGRSSAYVSYEIFLRRLRRHGSSSPSRTTYNMTPTSQKTKKKKKLRFSADTKDFTLDIPDDDGDSIRHRSTRRPPPLVLTPVEEMDRTTNNIKTTTKTNFLASYSKSHSSEDRWKCPVCFFRQTESNLARCAMCDSENPYKNSNEVRWLCSVCTYANKEGATECSMCGVKLHVLMHSPISRGDSSPSFFSGGTSTFRREAEYASFGSSRNATQGFSVGSRRQPSSSSGGGGGSGLSMSSRHNKTGSSLVEVD